MSLNPVQRLFAWKVRGIRWIEIIGVVCVAAMIFSVYVAKAGAARESARIDTLEREIADHHQRVRLLRAEAARLESPTRLEALASAAGLVPVEAERQADEFALARLKPAEVEPAPVVVKTAAAPASVRATTEPDEAAQ